MINYEKTELEGGVVVLEEGILVGGVGGSFCLSGCSGGARAF